MSDTAYPQSIVHLTPEIVCAYLARKGWRQRAHNNYKLIVMEGVAPAINDTATVVFPANATFTDYPAKLRDAVELLSGLFDLSTDALVGQILHWNRDILRVRIMSSGNMHLPPLEVAVNAIGKYRDFVAFAAATEAEPRNFFTRLTKVGRDHVEKCQFGHTFVGSFGITIECPLELPAELPMPNLPPPRPFQRRVTERIASGILSIRSALEHGDPNIIARNVQAGLSGNMCDALAAVYEAIEGREFTQTITWSPELPPPAELEDRAEPLKVNQYTYEIIQAASQKLHEVDDPDEVKLVVGRITRLESERSPIDADAFEAAARTIVVLWQLEKRQVLRLHVELSRDEYRDACDAHKNGKSIRVVGLPVKIGKYWHLNEPREFAVIT